MLLNNRKIFDQNPENKPFTFILGQGQVISGWDIGISSMKKGEMSMLLLAPEYGYGSEGYPPKIPPRFWFNIFHKSYIKSCPSYLETALLRYKSNSESSI